MNAKHLSLLTAATVALTLASAQPSFATDAAPNAAIRSTLAGTTALNLPAKAAELVAQAGKQEQASVTAEVIQAAASLNQAGLPAVVSAVSRAVPTMAPAAAAKAAALQPKLTPAIAKAAAAAAPKQATQIVTAMCAEVPAYYASVAVAVTQAVPSARQEILAAAAASMPAARPAQKTVADSEVNRVADAAFGQAVVASSASVVPSVPVTGYRMAKPPVIHPPVSDPLNVSYAGIGDTHSLTGSRDYSKP